MKTSNQPKKAHRTSRRVLWTTGALAALLAVGLAPSATANLAGADSCETADEPIHIITDPIVNFKMGDYPACTSFGMDQGITVHADVAFTYTKGATSCRVTWTATVTATNPGFLFDYTWVIGREGGAQLGAASHALNGPQTITRTETVARGASISVVADIENDDLGIDDANASQSFTC